MQASRTTTWNAPFETAVGGDGERAGCWSRQNAARCRDRHGPAAWWYRHNVSHLLRRLDRPHWDITLAVSPDVRGMASRVWPRYLPRMPQGEGPLGERMKHLLEAFSPAPTCIIGSDIPNIRVADVRSCFTALGSHDGVLGPSPDGGYWLIGMRNKTPFPHSFLQNVRWSSAHARADTMASHADVRWALGPTRRDVDTRADLIAVSR